MATLKKSDVTADDPKKDAAAEGQSPAKPGSGLEEVGRRFQEVHQNFLRVRLHDTQTFADLLKNVQQVSPAAFEHQALPFPKLVDGLNGERVVGYPPLYQVVFNFQNASLIESANPRAEGK